MNHAGNAKAAFEDFEGTALCLVIVADDGAIRTWLSREVETKLQHDWLERQLTRAIFQTRTMDNHDPLLEMG